MKKPLLAVDSPQILRFMVPAVRDLAKLHTMSVHIPQILRGQYGRFIHNRRRKNTKKSGRIVHFQSHKVRHINRYNDYKISYLGVLRVAQADDANGAWQCTHSYDFVCTENVFNKPSLACPRLCDPASDGSTLDTDCLLYTSPSPRDTIRSRMPSSA